MPYGLFDYTPDATIHTMGLSPTAEKGESWPPPLPPGWTDPYGSNENKPGTFPEPPTVTGYQQNVGENPYTRGNACEQTGNCNPNPPVSTLAIPENPVNPQPQPQSQSNGQGSPPPPTPPGTRPPNYGKPPVTLAIPEDPSQPPSGIVTKAIPENPGDPTPKPIDPRITYNMPGENLPIGPISPTPAPVKPIDPRVTFNLPGENIPAPITAAMVCSENQAACPKPITPPPLGPVTLAIPENPAAPTPAPAPAPMPSITTYALGEEGDTGPKKLPPLPAQHGKQWCGFAINIGTRIERVCGTFSHHLQKGNPKGGTVIFVGGDMGVIVYPTFQQALDAKRKGR